LLHYYSRLVAATTLLLVVAGGLVTSTGSGLSVPDWPTTYGWSMFTFPLSKMVGGIYYEHGHRLIASTVGMLTIVLAIWLWVREPRRWVRRLGLIALGAVVVQGLLGGLTVLFFLPAPISIAHAGLAEIFFCLTVTIAVATSPGWLAGYSRRGAQERREAGGESRLRAERFGAQGREGESDTTLRRLTVATTGLIFVQILVGATMRHTDAGLAIPDVPLAFGRVIPPLDRFATSGVAIHFAHRVGALIVLAAVAHVWTHHRARGPLVRPALLASTIVVVQILLGGLTVWSGKHVGINTAHVATGASLLVTMLTLTLRVHQMLGGRREPPSREALRRLKAGGESVGRQDVAAPRPAFGPAEAGRYQ
jgi:cytochrome c oxidase assembly protein subunit 15